MDMNLVVLAGRLAAPPEVRRFESGSCLLRVLVTVRSHAPQRRVDVVPVTLWDPIEDHEMRSAAVGKHVWVVGSIQRRFWSGSDGRRSRLEVIANHMELTPNQAAATTTSPPAPTAAISSQPVD